MFYAKDQASLETPYLVKFFGEPCWAKKTDRGAKLMEFSSAEEAIKVGQQHMPSEALKARVVAEPV